MKIDSAYVASRAASSIVVVIVVALLAPVMRVHWPVALAMIGLLGVEVILWIVAVKHVYGGRNE